MALTQSKDQALVQRSAWAREPEQEELCFVNLHSNSARKAVKDAGIHAGLKRAGRNFRSEVHDEFASSLGRKFPFSGVFKPHASYVAACL
jgi:hypothetical protein